MINKDSEDEFLDKLYARSANEKPPADLDKKILEEAKNNRHFNLFSMTIKFQRILSVAAVMVLSVYIFFDVGGNRSTGIDEALLYPQKSKLRSSPAVPHAESIRINDAVDDISESNANDQNLWKSDIASPKSLSSPIPPFQKSDTDVEYGLNKPSVRNIAEGIETKNESNDALSTDKETTLKDVVKSINQKQVAKRRMASSSEPEMLTQAEDMLNEIERLLANEEPEEANKLYRKLKLLFPAYPIPNFVADSIEDDKNILD